MITEFSEYQQATKETAIYPPNRAIVDNRYLIEIKPKYLWNDKTVRLKNAAAKLFCKKNKLTYKIIDYPVDNDLIKHEYLLGNIRFIYRSTKQFQDFIDKLKS